MHFESGRCAAAITDCGASLSAITDMRRSSSTTCKTSSQTFLAATSSVTTMGFMFYTCAPRTARALTPKPWRGEGVWPQVHPGVVRGARAAAGLSVSGGYAAAVGSADGGYTGTG